MQPTSPLAGNAAGQKERTAAVFFLCCLMAALFLLPFVVADGGVFLYFGDYNVQEIPFYQHVHQLVRSGHWFWDFGTDLGVNFIGSYSFYMLGSPFFWLMLPFPTSWVPYLMAPMFCLKFGVCGLTAYVYLRRFVQNRDYAMLGAILYAFSGFTVYNIFFNHFVDVVALFPLLLIGLERYVVDGKKGGFAIAVALNMMLNYFFFVGQAVFLLLYFLCRLPCREFRVTPRVFFGLAFETVLGCMGGLVLFLPGILAVLGNPRVDNFLFGQNLLFYGETQRYGGLLSSLFFMPEVPSRPNFFPQEWAKWSSMSAWLPLFSLTALVAYFRTVKKSFVKRALVVCAVMAAIPILNSAFYAFNNSYYARWFYMPILLMCLGSVKALELPGVSFRKPAVATGVAIGCFALIGLVPAKKSGKIVLGAEADTLRFWVWIAFSAACLALFCLLLRRRREHPLFFRATLACLCAVSVAYSLVYLSWGRKYSYGSDYMRNTALAGGAGIVQQDDSGFYRSDYYSAMDNLGMFWQTNTIQCFHTVVPVSLIEFYEYLGVTRDVHSNPPIEQYALRNLLSVKYLYDDQSFAQSAPIGQLPGYLSLGQRGDFEVYQNQNYLPMGFAYSQYMTQSQCDALAQSIRSRAMLQAVLLDEEGINENQDLLSPAPDMLDAELESYNLKADCDALRAQSAYAFEETRTGFLSRTDLARESLVFYSVPYDEGFTATANGKPVKIYRANAGFMAVRVPAGECEIVFSYDPPGLTVGKWAFVGFAAIYLLYLPLCLRSARRPGPPARRIRRAH
ncbi:YfhO family protein [Bittarella massiliensis (ex Durand et al. 2017)]|uniref:YfhO family protein n=1 Tax=Bittarella massiliensis (ex Durand et al. 2017) TaxID=1720313 RepID=UPI001FAE263F|nr:YfhO family protein [Bittarella massiliensis (ex Durand et al. 2017)]